MRIEQGVLDWLLEEKNPSVRYRTFTELLDKPVSDAQVVETKAHIAESEPVQFIHLFSQKPHFRYSLWQASLKRYGH
jgi:hypothetical protein